MSYYTELSNFNSTSNVISFKLVFDNKKSDVIISHTLHNHLCEMKEQIKECGEDAWDNMKKFTNPYEFIHTSIPNSKCNSISKLKPLSRSFYKLIELEHIFDLVNLPNRIKSFHLAEGPGGFIEALMHIRSKNIHQENDVYYGMTLINSDASCPGWKKSKSFLDLHRNQLHIENGVDGTGNIISQKNFQECIATHKNEHNFITADGGFDFSCDFNNQETMMMRLLISEMAFALALQKHRGNFVLKIFDTFTKPTIDVLYILSNFYEKVYISKPCTSRYANSERYVVCKSFKPTTTPDNIINDLSELLKTIETSSPTSTIVSLLPIQHDIYFLNKIEECNAIIGQQQMETICYTINLITNKNNEKLESMKRNNLVKCVNWCEKHSIPHNKMLNQSNIFLNSY